MGFGVARQPPLSPAALAALLASLRKQGTLTTNPDGTMTLKRPDGSVVGIKLPGT